MSEPLELTQKIKTLFDHELTVVTYIGTSREGEPIYMLSDVELNIMKDCFMGSPWFMFVNRDDILHSKVMQWVDPDFYYLPDPDLELDPITGKKPVTAAAPKQTTTKKKAATTQKATTKKAPARRRASTKAAAPTSQD